MNLEDKITRCIGEWPERIEVQPHFSGSWGRGLFHVDGLIATHDMIDDTVIGTSHEVPDRLIHDAIMCVLKDAALCLTVVRPRELRAVEVARRLLSLAENGSFDPEIGYTSQDRAIIAEVARQACSMVG